MIPKYTVFKRQEDHVTFGMIRYLNRMEEVSQFVAYIEKVLMGFQDAVVPKFFGSPRFSTPEKLKRDLAGLHRVEQTSRMQGNCLVISVNFFRKNGLRTGPSQSSSWLSTLEFMFDFDGTLLTFTKKFR